MQQLPAVLEEYLNKMARTETVGTALSVATEQKLV
jgi:hypothetical protein